jgi:hypothetical protein
MDLNTPRPSLAIGNADLDAYRRRLGLVGTMPDLNTPRPAFEPMSSADVDAYRRRLVGSMPGVDTPRPSLASLLQQMGPPQAAYPPSGY